MLCQLQRDFFYFEQFKPRKDKPLQCHGAGAASQKLHSRNSVQLLTKIGFTWVLTCSGAESDFLTMLLLCSWSAPGKMEWNPRHRSLIQCTLKITLQSVCAGYSEHMGIEHLPGSIRPFLQSRFPSPPLHSSSYTTFPPLQHLLHFENSLTSTKFQVSTTVPFNYQRK